MFLNQKAHVFLSNSILTIWLQILPFSSLSLLLAFIRCISFIEFKIPSAVRCTIILCSTRKKIKCQTIILTLEYVLCLLKNF